MPPKWDETTPVLDEAQPPPSWDETDPVEPTASPASTTPPAFEDTEPVDVPAPTAPFGMPMTPQAAKQASATAQTPELARVLVGKEQRASMLRDYTTEQNRQSMDAARGVAPGPANQNVINPLAAKPPGQIALLPKDEIDRIAKDKGEQGFVERMKAQFTGPKAGEKVPFVGAIIPIVQQIQLRDAIERYAHRESAYLTADDPLKAEDRNLIVDAINKENIARTRGTSVLGTAADIISALPTFVTEFGATGGIYTFGKQAAAKAGLAAGKNAVTRTLGKAGQAAIGSALQSTASLRAVESATRRQIPQYAISADEADNITLAIEKNGDEGVAAAWKGWLDNYIEYWSERTGEVPGAAMSAVGKKVLKALPKSVGETLTHIAASPAGKSIAGYIEKLKGLGVHSTPGEMFEEEVGKAARAVTGLEDYHLTTPKEIKAQFLAFSVLPVGAGTLGYIAGKQEERQQVKDLVASGMPKKTAKAIAGSRHMKERVEIFTDWRRGEYEKRGFSKEDATKLATAEATDSRETFEKAVDDVYQQAKETRAKAKTSEDFKAGWTEAGIPQEVVEKMAEANQRGDKAGWQAIFDQYQADQATAARAAVETPPKTPATATEEAPTPTQGPAPKGGKAAQAGPAVSEKATVAQTAPVKGQVLKIHDLPIKVETPAGEARKEGFQPLKDAYGHVQRTEGADGDNIDVFVNRDRPEGSDKVYVVDQLKKDGTPDEQKIIVGANSPAEAETVYRRNYPDDWNGFGGVKEYTPDEFKAWVKSEAAKEGEHATGPAIQVDRADGEVAPDTAAGAVRRDGESDTAGVEAARPPAPAKGTGVRASPDVQPQEKVKEKASEVVPEKPEVPQREREPARQLQEGRQAADEAPEPRQPDVLSRQAQPAATPTSTAGGVAGPISALISIDRAEQLKKEIGRLRGTVQSLAGTSRSAKMGILVDAERELASITIDEKAAKQNAERSVNVGDIVWTAMNESVQANGRDQDRARNTPFIVTKVNPKTLRVKSQQTDQEFTVYRSATIPFSPESAAKPQDTGREPTITAPGDATREISPSIGKGTKPATLAQIRGGRFRLLRDIAKHALYENGKSVLESSGAKSTASLRQALMDHHEWYNSIKGIKKRARMSEEAKQKIRDTKARRITEKENEHWDSFHKDAAAELAEKIKSGALLPVGTEVYVEDGDVIYRVVDHVPDVGVSGDVKTARVRGWSYSVTENGETQRIVASDQVAEAPAEDIDAEISFLDDIEGAANEADRQTDRQPAAENAQPLQDEPQDGDVAQRGDEAGRDSLQPRSEESLTLESPTDADIEAGKRREKIRKEQDARLTAKPIDTTGDLFDADKADNPLFAPPTPKPKGNTDENKLSESPDSEAGIRERADVLSRRRSDAQRAIDDIGRATLPADERSQEIPRDWREISPSDELAEHPEFKEVESFLAKFGLKAHAVFGAFFQAVQFKNDVLFDSRLSRPGTGEMMSLAKHELFHHFYARGVRGARELAALVDRASDTFRKYKEWLNTARMARGASALPDHVIAEEIAADFYSGRAESGIFLDDAFKNPVDAMQISGQLDQDTTETTGPPGGEARFAENQNLVVAHNLSADKLRHALKVGGLAVPSVAIIDAEKSSFDSFGDITLLGGPHLVDPAADKDAKVFNADAYSPRYPTVKFFIDRESENKLSKFFGDLLGREKNLESFSKYVGSGNVEDKGVADALYNDPSAQVAYLIDTKQKLPKFKGRNSQSADFHEVHKIVRYDDAEAAKFKAWVDGVIEKLGINQTEKIFNGYTNSGNRRYLPHNLDTVVRLMKKKLQDGEGFNYGVPSIRAAYAKRFRSIEAIQKDRNKIISAEQMEALKKESSDEFVKLAEYAQQYRENLTTGFGGLDQFSDDMKAMIEGDWKYLREQYPSGEPFDRMREFLNMLRDMPTEYFEGKIRRAVDVNEFSAAIVPDTTPDDLISALKDRGIEVAKYKRGDSESRKTALQTVTESQGLRFAEPFTTSTKNAQTDKEREKYGLTPAMQVAQREFGTVWNDAMAEIDADDTRQERLVEELAVKPRPVTDTENAILLHAQITEQLKYNRAAAMVNENYDTSNLNAVDDWNIALNLSSNRLQRLFDIIRATGTANARGLNSRRMMANDDFTLAAMETHVRADKGGNPLTADERAALQKIADDYKKESEALAKRLASAEERLANSETDAFIRAQMLARLTAEQQELLRDFNAAKKELARESDKLSEAYARNYVAAFKAVVGIVADPIRRVDAVFAPRNKESADRASAARERLLAKLSSTQPRFAEPGMGAEMPEYSLTDDLVAIADDQISNGMMEKAQFEKYVADNFGKLFTPDQVNEAWQRGWVTYADSVFPLLEGAEKEKASKLKAARKPVSTEDKIRKRIVGGATAFDIRQLVQALAADFIRKGVKQREPLIDAVHGALTPILPTITRRETMDAISGYGDYTQLDQDEIKVQLRDLKGQMQQVAKIEDLEAKRPLKKTGVEHREKSDAERRLEQQVNELKRRLGVRVTDPATQLKSALDAIKTRLKHQIDDLTHQLETGTKIVKTRTPILYDTAATDLKAKRDALKAEFDEMFGKPGLTDEQRIRMATASVERSIEEYERRIREGDLKPRIRVAITPETPALKALRARRDALKEQLAELRALANPKATPEERALAAFKKRSTNRIAELNEKIATGDVSTRKRKPITLDPEAQLIRFRLEAIQKRFNEMRMQAQLAARSIPAKIFGGIGEVFNTSRAMMTSFDLSGILRQGGFIVLGNPARGIKAIPEMLRAFVSERAEHASNEQILARANAPLYAQAKLFLHQDGNSLSKMEEAFMARWIKKIPRALGGGIIRGSQRAYTTFLNRLRADTFDAMVNALGHRASVTEEEAMAIANYINVATGRGTLGKFEQSGVLLSTFFFAPRLVASRFQLLAGQPLYGGTARTKALVAKEYAKYLTAILIIYALAAQAFDDDDDDKPVVELDTRSSDLGKIRIGETRVDLLSGLAQATVFASRLLPDFLGGGKVKKASGEFVSLNPGDVSYVGKSRFDIITRFLRTKLSPAAGGIINLLVKEDLLGRPVDPASEAVRQLMPLTFRDIRDAMVEQGVPAGTALAALALLGAGMQTYNDDQVWAGVELSEFLDEKDVRLPSFKTTITINTVPQMKVKGVDTKMTQDQYDQWVYLSQQLIRKRMMAAVPEMRSYSPEDAKEASKKIVKDARADAKKALEASAHNPSYDPESVLTK